MIVLGRIVAPYGIKGWLRIHTFADDPDQWCALPQWWLGAKAEGDAWKPYRLLEVDDRGKGIVVRLEGVEDRTAAEALDGYYIAAPREAMPPTGEDEFYWADLIGLEVVNETGEPLGRVASLIEATANDVLVVREEGEQGRERLLPFVAQVVKQVDIAEGRISVAWEKDW